VVKWLKKNLGVEFEKASNKNVEERKIGGLE